MLSNWSTALLLGFLKPSSETATMPAQLTNLLTNDAIARLERLRVKPHCHFTNRFTGSHQARKGGTSTDFADFRDYTPGDDMRFVDWNSFSRLHRPYIKLFHEEEITHFLVLIDGSKSMQFEGKFQRAKELAAAFSLMALRHTERLSIQCLTQKPHRLLPCTGRASMNKVFTFLERLDEPDDTVPFEIAIEKALQHHSGRGIVILLSDFLTFGSLKRSFNALFSSGLEILALQLLGPTEIDPDITSDFRLVDAELDENLDVSVSGDLLQFYQDHRLAYQEELASLCQSRSGRFLSVSTESTLEGTLFDTLRRAGWVSQ